jgi:hypothetical protein
LSGSKGELIPLDAQQIELARFRLDSNPHIRKFLSKWVDLGFSEPVLGKNILLDLLSDKPKCAIEELERVLKSGKSCCQGFKEIFRGNPSSDSRINDNQVLDRLAEVEAFHWLSGHGFTQVCKLSESSQKMVDFSCYLDGLGYGVEVTRLGIPNSERKKVSPFAQGACWQIFDGKTAAQKIETSIWEAIMNKLPQLKEFGTRNPAYKLMLVISTGHRFLLSHKVVRGDARPLPRTWRDSLESAWTCLDNEKRIVVTHVLLIDGRNERVYPAL